MASDAARVLKIAEAQLTPGERAAVEEAETTRLGLESARIAELTNSAAQASAGKGAGRAGKGAGVSVKGASGTGGRGRGQGSVGGDATGFRETREARAAEAAARQSAKATADAKAADDALGALRASDITFCEASELRKGGHVLLLVGARQEPCKIQELTTSKTGKHGHAKIALTATDVASGRKVQRNVRADERVTVPGKRWLIAISGVGID